MREKPHTVVHRCLPNIILRMLIIVLLLLSLVIMFVNDANELIYVLRSRGSVREAFAWRLVLHSGRASQPYTGILLPYMEQC